MSVATHLGIDLREYDTRIRTFIPDYEEMLGVAAAALPARTRTIVDLGTGTGALAARCLAAVPRARVVGIDADAEILRVAAQRLGDRASFIRDSFLRTTLPSSDAAVASFSLHHIRTRAAKARLYARIARALRRRGRFLLVDCFPATDATTAAAQRDAWFRHLRRSYSRRKAASFFEAWSHEDVHFPLDTEIEMLGRAGFRIELLWRKGSFAVLMGAPRSR
jgi:ubiquinone/menaquinone biosynthesis C-methylase UbiE